MPRDVPGFLAAQQAGTTPELAQEWAQLEELYNKRLWHQLTQRLLQFVKHPSFESGNGLLQLYENFLAEFETKINALSLVEIVAIVVKQIPDTKSAIEFLEKTTEKVKANQEASILCQTLIGQLKLVKLNDLEGTKKLIEETNEKLEAIDGITSVHGRFYDLSSSYYRIIGKHADYYRDALRYLGCTNIADIPADEQSERAFYLCLAALLGEGVYNFGELLAHPVIEALRSGEKAWLVELLFAFNSGNLVAYDQLKPQWTSQPDLVANQLALRQKISLLCLMEMTFKRSAKNRQLSFDEIAHETQLVADEVELLVMKALSLDLIRGLIDQVEQKVHVTWVQPRVLDKNQIQGMQGRIDQWCKDVHTVEILLENNAVDIMA